MAAATRSLGGGRSSPSRGPGSARLRADLAGLAKLAELPKCTEVAKFAKLPELAIFAIAKHIRYIYNSSVKSTFEMENEYHSFYIQYTSSFHISNKR